MDSKFQTFLIAATFNDWMTSSYYFPLCSCSGTLVSQKLWNCMKSQCLSSLGFQQPLGEATEEKPDCDLFPTYIPLDKVPGLLCGGVAAMVVVQNFGDDLGHLVPQL